MKTGVLGGTFDPIHNGHIALAKEAMREFDLDRVAFITVSRPPHKNGILSYAVRLEMLSYALTDHDRKKFRICNIEALGKKISYTVDTIRDMREIFPDDVFYFIMGSDALSGIESWKSPGEFLSMCECVMALRPGSSDNAEGLIERIEAKYNTVIHRMDMPLIDISSSEIRRRCANGESITGLVHEKVEEYIIKKGLYKNEHNDL